MNQARLEYQDRVNFVIWDFDRDDDYELADELGVAAHPAFGALAPDSARVEERLFGPLNEARLRELLESLLSRAGR